MPTTDALIAVGTAPGDDGKSLNISVQVKQGERVTVLYCQPHPISTPTMGTQRLPADTVEDIALRLQAQALPLARYTHANGLMDAAYVEFAAGSEQGGGVCADGTRHPLLYTRAAADSYVNSGVWRKLPVEQPKPAGVLTELAARLKEPDFKFLEDLRHSEMTPAERDDALEGWLRKQARTFDHVGWSYWATNPAGPHNHIEFLLKRIDYLRGKDAQ
jgi:hypothetical protein